MAEVARLQTVLAEQWPLLTSIAGIKAAFGTKDDDRLDAVLKDAGSLDEVVQHRPNMADDLEALAEVIATIDEPVPLARGEQAARDADPSRAVSPAPGAFAPSLVERARTLLAPTAGGSTTQPLTIEETGALGEEVPKLVSALKLLRVVAEMHPAIEGDPPTGLDKSDEDVWYKARRLVRQARAEFALAADVATIGRAKVDEIVTRARGLFRQVAPPPAPGEEGARLESVTAADFAPQGSIPIIGGIGRLLGAAWSQVSTRRVDLFWLLVAIALAVWSGLTLYWFDKPWGRPTDVIVLLVWALGTATLLTPILSALEDVVGRPTPLKRPIE